MIITFDNERAWDKSLDRLAKPPSKPASNLAFSAETRDLLGLIKRVASGDDDAFARLYDMTSPIVFGLAVRMLGKTAAAEEALCEAYHQVQGQASEYDSSACTPLTWLITIIRGIALDRLAKDEQTIRHDVTHEVIGSENRGKLDTTLSYVVSKPRSRALLALKTLTPDERQALESAYFSGLKVREIAKHLSQSVDVVQSLTRRGMIKLREQFDPVREKKSHGGQQPYKIVEASLST